MKSKKSSNKNSLKEIYKKVNHNKYSQIVNLSGKIEVKSNIKNFLYNYKYLLIALFYIIVILFIYTFRNTPITILYCFGFLLALLLLAMYSASYKILLDEENLNIHINFQNTTIKTNDLINIYLSREKMHLFWIPIYNYSLNIIYNLNDTPMIISLPTVMINRKKLVKLFSMIETEKIKDEEEEILAKEKNNKIVISTIISVVAIFIIVSIILAIVFQ